MLEIPNAVEQAVERRHDPRLRVCRPPHPREFQDRMLPEAESQRSDPTRVDARLGRQRVDRRPDPASKHPPTSVAVRDEGAIPNAVVAHPVAPGPSGLVAEEVGYQDDAPRHRRRTSPDRSGASRPSRSCAE